VAEDSDILEVKCPLPIKRVGAIERLWLQVKTAGLLRISRFTSEPVTIDAYSVAKVFSRKSLFRVTLTCKGIAAAASSTTSSSEAMHKAFSELCESFQLFDETYVLGRTRNGFAAHEDEDSAREYAYRELVERDSLITHFLCPEVRAVPPKPPPGALQSVQLAELWSADPTIRVVLCGLRDAPDTPWFFGAGTSQKCDAAREKAYVECVSTYCCYRHADEAAGAVGARHAEILKHVSASQEAPMRRNIQAIFLGAGHETPKLVTSMTDASFRTLARLGKAVVVVAARHPSLCSLTFGRVWENSKRETMRLLEERGLEPVWTVHPFA
jgi:hypothetical protein